VEPIVSGRSETKLVHVSSVGGKEEVKIEWSSEENQWARALLEGALQRRIRWRRAWKEKAVETQPVGRRWVGATWRVITGEEGSDAV
jgi:hypothetical protein